MQSLHPEVSGRERGADVSHSVANLLPKRTRQLGEDTERYRLTPKVGITTYPARYHLFNRDPREAIAFPQGFELSPHNAR